MEEMRAAEPAALPYSRPAGQGLRRSPVVAAECGHGDGECACAPVPRSSVPKAVAWMRSVDAWC